MSNLSSDQGTPPAIEQHHIASPPLSPCTERSTTPPGISISGDRLISDLVEYIKPTCSDNNGLSTIISSKWLDDIDMIVYKPHRIFICRGCESGVDASNLLSHVSDHKLVPNINKEQFEYVKAYYKIRPAMEIPSPQDRIYVPYLRIHDGIECPHCDTIVLTEGSMSTHRSKKHLGLSTGKKPNYRKVKCQTLFPVPCRYFEMTPPSVPITTAFDRWLEDDKDNTHSFFDSTAAPIAVEVGSSDISPFLKYTRWHQHLSAERQNPVKGEALVEAASTGALRNAPFKYLQSVVIAYYKHIRSLLLNCDQNVRIHLLQHPAYVMHPYFN